MHECRKHFGLHALSYNSTLTITRLTSETAFRGIFQRNMMPNMSSTIIRMVTTTSKAEIRSQPSRRKTTTKTAARETPANIGSLISG